MELLFYVITRADGGQVDESNETPYLACNDVEEANDRLNKLPNVPGGYRVERYEVNSEWCNIELYAEAGFEGS